MAADFLSDGRHLRQYIVQFSLGGPMVDLLAMDLRGYASVLFVMQLLESRHHLVHQQVSASRGSLPSTTCAKILQTVLFVKNHNL